MAWTLDDALNDESVTVLSRDDQRGAYEIRAGDLDTVVTIELGRFLASEWTKFSVSHAIKTPLQAGPYQTSRPFADYPGYALHQAITGLTSYYRDAVKAGKTPAESWLVEV